MALAEEEVILESPPETDTTEDEETHETTPTRAESPSAHYELGSTSYITPVLCRVFDTTPSEKKSYQEAKKELYDYISSRSIESLVEEFLHRFPASANCSFLSDARVDPVNARATVFFLDQKGYYHAQVTFPVRETLEDIKEGRFPLVSPLERL